MADLQPLGSEKLTGMDKINRILEISRFKENSPNSVNETSRNEYNLTLADGNEYQIVREKSGYIIKKTISEGTSDYIEPMKNRKYYPSYSQALKRLNLMAKETNTLHENKEGISLFSEQKKFVLKTPNAEKKNPDLGSDIENVPPPAPAPAEPTGATPPPAPADMGGADMPPPPPGEEGMGDETAPLPDDMGGEGMDDMGDEHEEGGVTFKSIQKLTGKLGQKLRALNSDEENKMSSKDVKYVINSIISALDIDSLDDDDKEEIISKFDEVGDEESDEDMGGEDMGGEDMDGEDMGNDEMGEMTEEDSPWVGLATTGAANVMSNMLSNAANMRPRGQFSEEEDEDEDKHHVSRIADEMFVENKVESILSKYFTITEGEKEFNDKVNKERKIVKTITKKEITKEISRLSENVIQEISSRKFLKENQSAKFIGKTNKKNLVFELGNKQYKVSTTGDII
jgi:hypothetical protein